MEQTVLGRPQHHRLPSQTRWHRRTGVLSVLAIGLLLSGCKGEKQKQESADNMKVLAMAVSAYHDQHKAWPNSLDDIQSNIAAGESVSHVDDGKDFATVTTNPFTGDKPGYEYVKPKEKMTNAEWSKTPVFYQLRDGKRDMTLPVVFLDGSVRDGNAPPP